MAKLLEPEIEMARQWVQTKWWETRSLLGLWMACERWLGRLRWLEMLTAQLRARQWVNRLVIRCYSGKRVYGVGKLGIKYIKSKKKDKPDNHVKTHVGDTVG